MAKTALALLCFLSSGLAGSLFFWILRLRMIFPHRQHVARHCATLFTVTASLRVDSVLTCTSLQSYLKSHSSLH
jgi:hypothetical protein